LIVSDSYKPIADVLEKMKQDAVVDGELIAQSLAISQHTHQGEPR
jgi:hypothetical protein